MCTMAYPEASRRRYTGLGTQTMCPNQRKTDATQHQLFNIFDANASTPSETFNLSNTLKIVKPKTLCMLVSATQVCLNVSKSIVSATVSAVHSLNKIQKQLKDLLLRDPSPDKIKMIVRDLYLKSC